jgi:hypothetical protein
MDANDGVNGGGGRLRLGAWMLALGVVLAACSGGGSSGDVTSAKTESTTTTTTSTSTTSPSDSTELCRIFQRLAAGGAGPNGQNEASTADGWAARIETTEDMAKAAPAEWKDEAEIYVQMVKDRAQLASENAYVGVNDLPADVRTAFISSHREMQAQVDRLIAFMKQQCATGAVG